MADPLKRARPPAFDASSLAAAVGGRVLRLGRRPIRGGAVDSRRVEDGNAFFALAGENTDGHLFLFDAADAGAAALVVSREPPEIELTRLDEVVQGTPSVILVDDTLAALHRAAATWRSRFDPLVVAVTGSLAKTSTKEQVAEVLCAGWSEAAVLRNTANENNEIGVPLTLLRLAAEHRVAVLEMGMYMPGEIAVLCALAAPRIGIVTAVRGAHLERAGSIDAIQRGKRELVEALPAGGTATLNADDPRVLDMAAHAPRGVRVLSYGFDPGADVTAEEVESLGARGMRFRLRTPAGLADAQIGALGRHSVHNALAAAAAGLAAGMDLAAIVAGLARPWSVPHRTQLLDFGPWRVLDDSYNASPDSMTAALELLASLPGRRIAVLGEMLELGPASAAAHRAVGERAGRLADVLIAVGPSAAEYARGARAGSALVIAADTREEALVELPRVLRAGDVVLLKGSRDAGLETLVPVLQDWARSVPA